MTTTTTTERTLDQIAEERRELLRQRNRVDVELQKLDLEARLIGTRRRNSAYWEGRVQRRSRYYNRLHSAAVHGALVARLAQHPLLAHHNARMLSCIADTRLHKRQMRAFDRVNECDELCNAAEEAEELTQQLAEAAASMGGEEGRALEQWLREQGVRK